MTSSTEKTGESTTTELAAARAELQALRTELGRLKKPLERGVLPWRHRGRLIYDDHDQLLGMMETSELARRVVEAITVASSLQFDSPEENSS